LAKSTAMGQTFEGNLIISLNDPWDKEHRCTHGVGGWVEYKGGMNEDHHRWIFKKQLFNNTNIKHEIVYQ